VKTTLRKQKLKKRNQTKNRRKSQVPTMMFSSNVLFYMVVAAIISSSAAANDSSSTTGLLLQESFSVIINLPSGLTLADLSPQAQAFVDDATRFTFDESHRDDEDDVSSVGIHMFWDDSDDEEDDNNRRQLQPIGGRRSGGNGKMPPPFYSASGRLMTDDYFVNNRPPNMYYVITWNCRFCLPYRRRSLKDNSDQIAKWQNNLCQILRSSNLPEFDGVNACQIALSGATPSNTFEALEIPPIPGRLLSQPVAVELTGAGQNYSLAELVYLEDAIKATFNFVHNNDDNDRAIGSHMLTAGPPSDDRRSLRASLSGNFDMDFAMTFACTGQACKPGSAFQATFQNSPNRLAQWTINFCDQLKNSRLPSLSTVERCKITV
jgi:hypothetical protein